MITGLGGLVFIMALPMILLWIVLNFLATIVYHRLHVFYATNPERGFVDTTPKFGSAIFDIFKVQVIAIVIVNLLKIPLVGFYTADYYMFTYLISYTVVVVLVLWKGVFKKHTLEPESKKRFFLYTALVLIVSQTLFLFLTPLVRLENILNLLN